MANAQSENFMKPLSKAIKTANVEGKSWKQELYSFLRNYRATPHITTGKSPAELLFGKNIKITLPEFKSEKKKDKELRKRDKEKKSKMKMYADKRIVSRAPEKFKVGDMVLIKQQHSNKLSSFYNKTPTKVIKIKGNMISTYHPDLGYKTRNASMCKKVDLCKTKSCKDSTHVNKSKKHVRSRIRRTPSRFKEYHMY